MKRAGMLVAIALLAALTPVSHAADPLCDPACTVDQNGLAYLPPVLLVPSGSEVTFTSFDTSHVTVEGVGVGGGDSPCFFVPSAPGVDVPAVRLTIETDGLYAETLDGDGRAPVRCAEAIDTGGALFVLPYHCALHPTMRGALAVTAS